MNPVVRSFLFITFLVRGHIPPCKLDLQFPSKWSTSNKLKSLPQYVTSWDRRALRRCSWPPALPRLWTFQKPPARAYLTPAHRPSVRATQRLIYIIATH